METTSSQIIQSSSPKLPQPQERNFEVSVKPREYQKELAAPGLNGENYIVVAPTNSGKTLVAAVVIANHLKKKYQSSRPPKVVVVVKTRTLADQQTSRFGEYIPSAHVECRTGNRTFNRKLQLHIQDALPHSDIIVCTAGKLVDELRKRKLSLQEISLLVVDECHNIDHNSNYAQLLHIYIELKDQEATKNQLPQVIGLTATPGMGRSSGLHPDRVIDSLVTLCAYMDANGGIQTVRKHIDELKKFVRKPENYLDVVHQSEERVVLIQRIEKEMVDCESFLSFTRSSISRTSQQYLQIVSEKKIALENSADPGDRDKVSTARMLECYSQALINYIELPRDHVMDALDNYDDLTTAAENLTAQEKHLQEKFKKLKDDILAMEKYENPVLIKVKERLTNAFKNPAEKGIIFVRTREQADAINNWISSSEFAIEAGIRSEMLIGHSKKATGPCMSDDDQKMVVEQFRGEECNLLVATSVAEEGLDIQQCNLVMRLHISSAKSKAQMQGRARAEDSEIVTIVSNDPKKLYKDVLNDELPLLVERLIDSNRLPSDGDLLRKIACKQQEILKKVRNERELAKSRENSDPSKDVVLNCKKCKVQACLGSGIYYIDKTNHHVVPGPEFSTLYELDEHPHPGYLLGCDDIVLEKKHKIHCASCNADWGVLGTSSKLELPILKCEKFNFFVNGKLIKCARWTDRPFKALPLSKWFAKINDQDNETTDPGIS